MKDNKTIFVQIASYRDPECKQTIEDLYKKAKNPESIFVGINWQFSDDDDDVPYENSAYSEQIRVTRIPFYESKGYSWAIGITQKLYNGEKYTLQLDAHMRFVQDWDEILITMHSKLISLGYKKPILSHYPPDYTLEGEYKKVIKKMSPIPSEDGLFLFRRTGHIVDPKIYEEPIISACIAGGCFFADASCIKEVPYDPENYFLGHEISIAVRLWTRGWDMFNPNKITIYHLYKSTREVQTKTVKNDSYIIHQSDHSSAERNKRAKQRVKHLVGTRKVDDKKIIENLEKYSLGSDRTLYQYERFAGINFRKLTKNVYSRTSYWVKGKIPLGKNEESKKLMDITEEVECSFLFSSPKFNLLMKLISCDSLTHVGCGDLSDQRMVFDFEYIGVDINADKIKNNVQHCGSDKYSFRQLNYIAEALPKSQVIFCDKLFEKLPVNMSWQLIENIYLSKIQYVLTSFNRNERKLTDAPFYFPEPILIFPHNNNEAHLALWRLEDVAVFVQALDDEDSYYRSKFILTLEKQLDLLRYYFIDNIELLNVIFCAIPLTSRDLIIQTIFKNKKVSDILSRDKQAEQLIRLLIDLRYNLNYKEVLKVFPEVKEEKKLLNMILMCDYFEKITFSNF